MDVLYRDGVIEEDDLTFEEVRDEATGALVQVRLVGHVRCTEGVTVRVLKWMDVRLNGTDIEVLSVWYQYQAWLRKAPRRRDPTLVRYDQAHGGTPHRHLFTPDGRELCEPLTFETMPRLDAVIREAVELAASLIEQRRPPPPT